MIFGIDFGLKRIGVAKVIQNIVMPLPPIIRKNRNQAAHSLRTLLEESGNMSEITLVIGLPTNDSESQLKEEESPCAVMQRRVAHFLSLVEFCGKVVYIDESYSSVEASERLCDRHYKRRKNARKDGSLDSVSACIILERYLALQAQQDTLGHRDSEICAHTNSLTAEQNDKNRAGRSQSSMNHGAAQTDCSTEDKGSEGRAQIPLAYQHTQSQQDDGATKPTPHIPVLLKHVLHTFSFLSDSQDSQVLCDLQQYSDTRAYTKAFNLVSSKGVGQVLIDCTLGFGGMSSALLAAHKNLRIIGIDRDSEALEYNRKNMAHFGDRLQMLHGDFATLLPKILSDVKQQGLHVCGVLADIGVSSYQLDTLERGFSFHSKELDMRMDTTQTLRADVIVNTYSQYDLERIFRDYGEIREYKKLADLIVRERQKGVITGEILQNIALRLRTKGTIHPATLIYQALRIVVNDELGQLQRLLESCANLHDCVLCLISFHSLEDRIIKDTFKQWSRNCICDSSVLKCACGNNNAKGMSLYKKPLIASSEELRHNKRSRSAKLRAFAFTKSD